jgi:hypothetical protein
MRGCVDAWELTLTVQAMLCVCQALFMMTQYPKIGWEPIYMPICEAFNYGVGWGGFGSIYLADGR